MRGAQIGSNVNGRNLDDPALDPVWAVAERVASAFILVHPHGEIVPGDRLKSYYMRNFVGLPFETTMAGAALVFGGVIERYPDIAFCLCHGGGFVPYQAGRFVHASRSAPSRRRGLRGSPEASLARLHYDTSCIPPRALEFLIETAGADHVLLGSDYPFDMGNLDCVARVEVARPAARASRDRAGRSAPGNCCAMPRLISTPCAPSGCGERSRRSPPRIRSIARAFASWASSSSDIRSLDDLEALPLTRKDDYIADPEAFRLRPDDLPADFSAEERVLWDVAYTTGTTSGRPSPFYNTAHDAYAIWDQARRCNEAEGLIADDRVANLYPLAGFPTGAFLSVIRSGMIARLAGGARPHRRGQFRVQGAQFARRGGGDGRALPADRAVGRAELHPPLPRRGARGAAPISPTCGWCSPRASRCRRALRAEMREQLARLGAAAVDIRARYAFTEMQGGLVQCAEDAQPQNVCPDLYHLEVVDPDERPPSCRTARAACWRSPICTAAAPCCCAISSATSSRCRARRARSAAATGERVVATPRRTGSLVKCRGMLVNTDVILDTLSAMAGIGQFQIVFAGEDAPGAMERLVIRIEQDESEDTRLREEVTRRVREAVSLRPEVEFVARGALYDHERSIKAKRVLDLRTNDGLSEETHGSQRRRQELSALRIPRRARQDPGVRRRDRRSQSDLSRSRLRREDGLGGIIAPPTLLRTFLYEPTAASEALKVKDWSYIVHGEQEFEYLAPVLAGDVLTAQDRIVSITEKESRRAGKLQIAVIETTFHNQRGEKVQVARRTLVETGKRIEA